MRPDKIERFFRATLRLSHLRTLAALSRLGQVRKVAESFHVTQSAVSKQIAEIEAGLGEPVVRRQGNAVVLTLLGQRLAARATEVLLQLERARFEISSLSSGVAGKVAIGSVTTVNSDLVPGAIGRLRRRASQVTVWHEENTADRMLPMVLEHALDIAVVRIWQPLAPEGLEQRLLMHEDMVAVCGPAHPLASSKSLEWEDSLAHPWVVPRSGSPTRAALDALLASRGVRVPDGEVQSNSMSLNLALHGTDERIGLLARRHASRLAEAGQLCILPLDTRGLLSEVRAFWRRDDTDPACMLLLECLAEEAEPARLAQRT